MATQSPSGSATDNAKEQVQEKAQEAQEKVKGGAQQAQVRMREQVDQRSTQAGEQVSATAQALRTHEPAAARPGPGRPGAGRREGRPPRRAPRRVPSESSADRILSDLEDFGRRQPLAVIGLGVAVGFAASRFLKASSRERYQGRFVTAPTTSVPATPAASGPAMPVAVPPPAVSGNGA